MKLTVIRHSIRNRGGDKVVLDYLAYLSGQGHTIVYWTNAVATDFPIDPKIIIKPIPIPGMIGTILFTCFGKFQTDVLLVDLIVLAFFACLRNRSKVLCLAQGHDTSYHKPWIVKSFIRFCYKHVLSRLNVPAIAVAAGLAETLQQYRPVNLTTIPNGVNLKHFYHEASSSLRKEKRREFVILIFARRDIAKGLDIAEKALHELARIRNAQDWEVWSIGAETIRWEGIPVTSLGFIREEEKLRSILSAADIHLVASRSEGLSILLLQALACECAIVSTTASTILIHEVNGLVSPVGDSKALAQNLNRALSDEGLRNQLKRNARSLAEKFSFQTSCEQFEKTLQVILKDHRS